MSKTPTFLGLFLILGFTGCANVSSLQTARVVKKDQGRVFAGGGYSAIPELSDSSGLLQRRFPYLEFGGRTGIAHRTDIGLKLTLFGPLAIDVKYQLVDAGKFAMAAALGLGATPDEIGNSSSEDSPGSSSENTPNILELLFPLYASYDASKYFSVYTSPKYVYRVLFDHGAASINLVGATVGGKFGNNSGVYLESTFFRSLGTHFQTFQVNGALFWNF